MIRLELQVKNKGGSSIDQNDQKNTPLDLSVPIVIAVSY